MRLTVLGCAGTFPGPDSPCSGYLVEADGYRLLIDLGNGALGNLQRCAGLFDVNAALISHLHGDHCLDLVAYAYARRWHPSVEAARLPVLGPAGMYERLSRVYDPAPSGDLDEVYDIGSVGAGRNQLGPFAVELTAVDHPVETYAVRLAAGARTLTYSADTGPCDALVKAARGCDAFLCEASFSDAANNPPGVHLTGREAGSAAQRAAVGRLLLTHLVPWGDEQRSVEAATAAFDGPVEAVRACASYDV